jgi:hypothetical protein
MKPLALLREWDEGRAGAKGHQRNAIAKEKAPFEAFP